MPNAPAFPDHLDIDLSTKCNLRCRFCHLSYYTPRSWTQISLGQFGVIEPYLKFLKSITLFSKYEILTCRDFIPIFGKISEYPIETYFSTNGLLLTDEILKAIVGKLTFLTVSVTGYDPVSYKRNMGYDGLEKVRQNLARLNAMKAEAGTVYPKLRISTVGMLDTLDQLEPAVRFAHEFGAEEGLQITHLKAHGEEMAPLMPMNEPERFQAAVDKACALADEIGVKVDQQGGTFTQNAIETEKLGHRYCTMPWERLSIQPDGYVYPCPLSDTIIGNIFEEDARAIWQGEKLAQFRKGVNSRSNPNAECKNCSHCRHRSNTDPASNDFTKAPRYVAGMVRKCETVST